MIAKPERRWWRSVELPTATHFPVRPPWDGRDLSLIFRPPKRWANISDYEAFVLGALAIETDPETVFEIGTGDGYSAWILARNTRARVYTLDLPVGQMPTGSCPGDREAGGEAERGTLVQGDPHVVCLRGDSLTFDFSPWHRRCGLVFVDGAHSTPYVESDTRHALALVAPQGMVVWHDCDRRHPAVWDCLTRLADRLPIRSVPGTRFAVLAGAP